MDVAFGLARAGVASYFGIQTRNRAAKSEATEV
jgi:hypothetical protein